MSHTGRARRAQELVAEADARRERLRASLTSRRADLPLAFWRQAAHYTTPAGDAAMARKAVEGGSAPMARLLDRFGVSAARLAERLDVATSSVEQLVDHPVRAPLVMLDGEDAQALREDVLETG
ncbi:MAG: hypothetical protein H0V12_12535, partial [Chloroflexi bacterium]|nr:hypothetical protein [Chloroflexota bacterium]